MAKKEQKVREDSIPVWQSRRQTLIAFCHQDGTKMVRSNFYVDKDYGLLDLESKSVQSIAGVDFCEKDVHSARLRAISRPL